MRLRSIIFILAVFAFLLATIGGWLYYYSFRKAAFQKFDRNAASRLRLLNGQLSSFLSEHIKPVKALAGIKELGLALDKTNLETIYQANQILDHFTQALDIEVSYLLDQKGVTLCSSNRNEHDSFVGNNFSFRPYYREAIKGKFATYLALGTTSGKRGVYYSYPVYSQDNKTIIGVVVIKASIEFVETTLFSKMENILLFVDPNGVIFISNKKELRFKLLWQTSPEKINILNNTRQFGNDPLVWSGFSKKENDQAIDQNNTLYHFSSMDVDNYPGWQIISLKNFKEVEKQLTQPFIRFIGPVVGMGILITGLIVLILYGLAAKEIIRRKSAENELRLSDDRYRLIYNKTPVMLHSINREGKIIRVSDHWVEVIGYNRDEIIGRQLTDFFTPESKTYADNIIFPLFFRTGFCKEIPFTYVTKNRGKIDILLSCYGVRNEKGEVLHSLAVSVDVTEKNLAQKNLQIATDKLARHSQNLEQQVKKRTAQLENTQGNLKKLSQNIIASQEREKELVARELHDHLGQVLTVLRIDAVWIENLLLSEDEKSQERAQKMITLIDTTIQDVRDMAYRLRPRVLDDLGLVAALESLLSDFEKRSNVSCVFKHDKIPDISNTLATTLYRIGQEAVTNSLRHSKATTITMDLKLENDDLIMIIEDNGCGFSLNQNKNYDGFGLESMGERTKLVGGNIQIASEIDKGTRVCASIKMKG
ncbi:MAG: PAS domain-containing protein [Desulfobacteraceae bacterium]|nr:PAS domain-containing protein [Desulfobacteraceae bacterium]